jgi:hypothetical protein
MMCAMCRRAPSSDGPLCPPCRQMSAHDVAALALDFRDLGELVPGAGGLEQRVSGTRTPSVLVDLLADELARGIAWCLGVWEPPVREAAGLAPADESVTASRLVTRAAAVLSSRLSDFAALPDTWGYPDGLEGGCVARSGLYGVLSLRKLHTRSLAALGLATQAPMHLPGTCRRCEATALVRSFGEDFVQCRHCGLRLNAEEYRSLINLGDARLIHSHG